MKKQIVLLAVGLTLLLSVTGCGGNTTNSSDSSGEAGAESTATTEKTETAEKQKSELTEEQQAAVGTYLGAKGSVFVLFDDLTTEYYFIDYSEPIVGGNWDCEDNELSVYLDNLKVTMTTEFNAGEAMNFVGDNDSWEDEYFKKIDSNSTFLDAEECVNIRRDNLALQEKTQVNGFISATNRTVTDENVAYEVPFYYAEDDDRKDEETAWHYAKEGTPFVLLSCAQFDDLEKSDLDFGSFLIGVFSAFDNDTWLVDYNSSEGWFTFTTKFASGKEIYDLECKGAILYSDDYKRGALFAVLQPVDSENGYFDDFDRIVNSVVLSDDSAASSSDDATPKESAVSDISPDLKAFLDEYEKFVDKYVDFMEKYDSASSGDMVSMMSDYADIMEQYAEFADKLNQYDSDDMSVADAAYYLKVTSRCAQKMLEIYE